MASGYDKIMQVLDEIDRAEIKSLYRPVFIRAERLLTSTETRNKSTQRLDGDL